MNNPHSNLPVPPRLYYSTWGPDFYSHHWLRPSNCWMFGLIKYVEQNIDLNGDKEQLDAFHRFSGSDLMFIYPDPTQRERVREEFLKQYREVAKLTDFQNGELVTAYPVDPFKTVFIYVTRKRPKNAPKFTINKLSQNNDSVVSSVRLESEYLHVEDVHIYFHFFMLPPDNQFNFTVEGSEASKIFNTPDFGIPLHIVSQLKLKPKYNQSLLYDKLSEIWGNIENVPFLKDQNTFSQRIHEKSQLEKILKNKKVAVFKYNKELYSLLRFHELSPFTLEVVFDEVVSLNDAAEYIGCEKTNIPVVNDIEKISDFDFDALVLTCGLNFESEIPFFKALMNLAINRKIPIVSLYDDILQYDIFENEIIDNENFYRISLDTKDLSPPALPGPNECPSNLVGVFGTDTVQGKFTTQLYLRHALAKKANVAHWATEPTGTLLGANIGYSRDDDRHLGDDLLAIERKILIDLAADNDIVITGGQNSMVYAPAGGTREDNSSTTIFNMLLPRYIVLTVSIDTPVELVTQSIEYIQELAANNGIESKVVALAMMEGRKIHGGRWTDTYFSHVDNDTVQFAKSKLKELFDLPLFVVPDEADTLADTVLAIIK